MLGIELGSSEEQHLILMSHLSSSQNTELQKKSVCMPQGQSFGYKTLRINYVQIVLETRDHYFHGEYILMDGG